MIQGIRQSFFELVNPFHPEGRKEGKMIIGPFWEKKGDTIYVNNFREWHNLTGQTWADWVLEMIEEYGPDTKIAREGGVWTLREEKKYIDSLK
jgi:hypothetical protein